MDIHNTTDEIINVAYKQHLINMTSDKNRIMYGQYYSKRFLIKKVIFNEPATIVFWANGDKTVVKCTENDTFDKEKGLAMAIAKYACGNTGNYNNQFKKWIKDDE